MLELAGKPVLEHNICLLKKHGVTEIFINLHYLPGVVKDYFGDGRDWGVRIEYAYEEQLLGTAGAVRNFQRRLGNRPFFVIYGDNYTDFDLNEILAFHVRKEGLATLAVFEKQDVHSSGIVELDEDCRILRLMEKPRPEEVFSHLAISGIFVCEPGVLEHIPAGRYADFAGHVFPKMLQQGNLLYGIVMRGILEGIDTIELYERAMRLVQKSQTT
jgi:mannose-1-phosphate guanylyltransferase/phosphomannomutase